ncbi:MAG: 4-hydroxybenzoate octaprenyltransferase [Planctomycetota bacterium]
MLRRVKLFLEMIRFSHTLFALPFALLAAAMAGWANAHATPPAPFRWTDLLGILVCMVAARSAAMAFNRLADRQIDALNPRTSGRHLPQGTLSAGAVAAFTVLASLLFVAGTLLFLPQNWIPLAASLPVLLFLFGYSYAKRFTSLAHFWLGAALMLAPLAAWVAIRPEWSWAPLLLGLAVMLWVAGFDIIYACQDFEFDRQMRLRSVPALLGIAGALRVAAACHLAMIVALAILPKAFPAFGWVYHVGVAGIALLLVIEHSLVRPNDLRRVNQAFFHVNAVVSIGLLVIGVIDLWVA